MENFDDLLICHQFFLIHPSLNFALCISAVLAHTANQDLPPKECRFDSGPGTTDKAAQFAERAAFLFGSPKAHDSKQNTCEDFSLPAKKSTKCHHQHGPQWLILYVHWVKRQWKF